MAAFQLEICELEISTKRESLRLHKSVGASSLEKLHTGFLIGLGVRIRDLRRSGTSFMRLKIIQFLIDCLRSCQNFFRRILQPPAIRQRLRTNRRTC